MGLVLSGAGGCGEVHREDSAVGCGQAAGVPGKIWEWVPVSEMRVCAGADAGVCGAAGEILSGVQGTLCQYSAVYD